MENYTPIAEDGIDNSHCLSADPPTISRSDFLFRTSLPIYRYTYIMSAFLIMGLASPQTHLRGSGEVPRVAPLTVVDLNQLISWSLVHLRGPPSGGGGELRDDHTPQLEATSQLTIQFPEK